MKKWIALLGFLAALLVATSLAFGQEPWAECRVHTYGPLAVRLCTWPGVEKPDPEKVQIVLGLLVSGYDLKEPVLADVTRPMSGVLDHGLYGFYDPGSRVIFISPSAEITPGRFYYTLAHELAHRILDARGGPLKDHHCGIYTGPEMKVVEALMRQWIAPDFEPADPLRVAAICASSAEESYRPHLHKETDREGWSSPLL